MMKILAHRGYWKISDEKNSLRALTDALKKGWGIETDIRDYKGELVIAHNPADGNSTKLEPLFAEYSRLSEKPLLALNVKADGLYSLLPEVFERYNIKPENYFLFDMSTPEQYIYMKRGYKTFSRSSEFETRPIFTEQCDGIWLDQFSDGDHIVNSLDGFLKAGKVVSVVSPELHGRAGEKVWAFLLRYKGNDRLYLCTDKPDEAEEYFK